MQFESGEIPSTKKQEAWNRITDDVDRLRDRLGKSVDREIKQSVVALRALGFTTDSSCEGHVGTEQGIGGPWVDVGEMSREAAERLRVLSKNRIEGRNDPEIDRLRKEVSLKLLQEQARLVKLLDEFYRGRNAPYEQRLIVKFRPTTARLISQGAELQALHVLEVQQKNLQAYREEMQAFTDFLRKKYFSESKDRNQETSTSTSPMLPQV